MAAPAVPRPRGQWRGLDPTVTATGGGAASVAEPLGFVRTLSTRWQVPSALEPLGHEVSGVAPSGQVPVAGVPVQGYADRPELVWAAVPVAPPAPESQVAQRNPSRTPDAVAEADAHGGRPSVEELAAPVPGGGPVEVVTAPSGVAAVRPVVGTREPLAQARGFLAPEDVEVPAGSARDEVPAPAPAEEAARGHDVAVGPAAAEPVRRREAVGSPVVPGRAAAAEVLEVGGPEVARAARPQAAVDDAPAAVEGASAPAVLPVAPGARVERPSTDDAVPATRRMRGLVGDTPVLASRREPWRAAVPDVVREAAHAEVVADAVPTHVDAGPPAPGLGVPDWFSSGAVRNVPPPARPEPLSRPDAVAAVPPAAVDRGRVAAVLPPAVAGSRVDGEPRVAAAPSRRVPWPEPAETPSRPGVDDTDEPGPDGESGTDAAPDPDQAAEAPPARDVPEPVATVLLPHPGVVPSEPVVPSAPSRRPEPVAEGAVAPRRFRVGAPLPRPAAAARAVSPVRGLAELAAAAMAVTSPDEVGGGLPPGRAAAVDADGLQPDRRPLVGLLPADLGLPDASERSPAPLRVPPSEPEDHDDLDVPPTPSVDELYEQVRTRLRHELLVDRERAAMLAD